MKKSLLLVAAIALLAACNGQEKTKETDKVVTLDGRETIYGKVSSVKYTTYYSGGLNRFGEFERDPDEIFTTVVKRLMTSDNSARVRWFQSTRITLLLKCLYPTYMGFIA